MAFKNSVLNQIFGDKNFSDIDKKIDDLIEKLPKESKNAKNLNTSSYSSSNLVNDFLTSDDKSNNNEIDGIFRDISIPRERQARYNLYDEIIKSVPLVSRIIKVYSSNIIQKNPTTGQSIIFQQKKTDSEDKEEKAKETERFIKNFFELFQISKKLRNSILPKQLRYGDCFIEISGINEEDIDYTKASQYSIITEMQNLDSELDKINNSSNSLNAFDSSICKLADLITDVSINNEVKEDSKKKERINDFSDIVLKIHNPHNIIILETNYGTCLGYLEVLKDNQGSNFQFSQSLSGVVGKVNQLSNSRGQSQDQLTNRLVYYVLRKIITKAKKKDVSDLQGEEIENVLQSLDQNVYNLVKRMFIEQGFNKKKGDRSELGKIKARFIPTNRMAKFNNPNVSDYSPYSQSIIEDLILPGKLYMLNQLSNSVMKLSRSSLIRKWTVDIGSRRMASNELEKLKREIYNSRTTIDDLGSFKSVPKLLSDYKDMFIFSQDGQTPVDLDVQSYGDSNIKTEDLEDARKEMIAISGVPAPYVGLHDTVELREQLVHSNISFANEIINIQENIVESLNEISDIVGEIKGLDYKPSEYVKISLIPPVVLILQVIESTLSSIGSIAGVFQNLGLKYDPYYFLKYYVPHIDWDEFKERARQYSSESKAKEDLGGGEEQQGGGSYF